MLPHAPRPMPSALLIPPLAALFSRRRAWPRRGARLCCRLPTLASSLSPRRPGAKTSTARGGQTKKTDTQRAGRTKHRGVGRVGGRK
eukprot:9488454-Pyramimonas_sp.AAC.1